MNITLLLPDLGGGGAERVNLDLAHEFAREGHKVTFVLLRARGAFLPEANANFHVHDLGVDRARQVPLVLARYLRTHQPDAVIAAMWPLTTVAVIARLISGHHCKLLLVQHSTLSVQYQGWGRLHRWALRLSLAFGCRMADAVGNVSQGAADDLAKLAFLNPARLHVLHNPIPERPASSELALEQARAIWGNSSGARLLTVGSFKAVKNHGLLLRAFARFLAHREARLMILGDGELRPELEQLACQLGVAEQVLFPGFQNPPTPFYETADLFVLSSDYEGFGNVIVEAMGCGLPVVSTDCPSGPAEILEDGKYGTLVPVGDEVAQASAMQHALNTPVDSSVLKQRAADFAPEIAAQRYLELLT